MSEIVFTECHFCHKMKECHRYGRGGAYAACEGCASRRNLTFTCPDCRQTTVVRVGRTRCPRCQEQTEFKRLIEFADRLPD